MLTIRSSNNWGGTLNTIQEVGQGESVSLAPDL